MAVVSSTIFEEGKSAKATGQPNSTNPYEAGSQQSLDWLEGYTAGEPDPSAAGPSDE